MLILLSVARYNVFIFGYKKKLNHVAISSKNLFWFSDEFEDIIKHTTLNRHMPFNFDSDFIKLHFGKDKSRKVSYAEFTQLLHVSFYVLAWKSAWDI